MPDVLINLYNIVGWYREYKRNHSLSVCVSYCDSILKRQGFTFMASAGLLYAINSQLNISREIKLEMVARLK